jgi:hypothetical protein
VGTYYAAKARLAADLSIDDFWKSYPDLARGYDLRNGANIEPLFAKSMQERKAANYRTELEHYEPIRVTFAATGRSSWSTESSNGQGQWRPHERRFRDGPVATEHRWAFARS